MAIPFPEDVLAEGNRRMSGLCKMIGLSGIDDGSKVMLNMATAYAVVKSALGASSDDLNIRVLTNASYVPRVAVVPVQRAFGKLRSIAATVKK
ncbi:hypothetical protein HDU88_001169 [Geranomyces variabilis]|nr:hypothetical protein HDU88_001169 [Geranomyces variabilis]